MAKIIKKPLETLLQWQDDWGGTLSFMKQYLQMDSKITQEHIKKKLKKKDIYILRAFAHSFVCMKKNKIIHIK